MTFGKNVQNLHNMFAKTASVDYWKHDIGSWGEYKCNNVLLTMSVQVGINQDDNTTPI